MPRRHPRIYSQPKPAEDALADIERLLHEPDNASIDEMPQRQRPSIDLPAARRGDRDRDLFARADRVQGKGAKL